MASTYILRHDGVERFVEGDSTPTKNKIMALQKPNDDRRSRDDMTIRGEDMVKYVVTETSSEIWERYPGKFEGITVVDLQRVEARDG